MAESQNYTFRDAAALMLSEETKAQAGESLTVADSFFFLIPPQTVSPDTCIMPPCCGLSQ